MRVIRRKPCLVALALALRPDSAGVRTTSRIRQKSPHPFVGISLSFLELLLALSDSREICEPGMALKVHFDDSIC